MRFHKYQALGNAYLVFPEPHPSLISPEVIKSLCAHRTGIGSDGILIGPLHSDSANFRLHIYNPDGSEAEKSGNGIRIFCKYLHDQGLVTDQPFSIETLGGKVHARVLANQQVQVVMGLVRFDSTSIPVAGTPREVLNEVITLGDQSLVISCATIGNPHCVVFTSNPTEALARTLGPQLETHPLFPNRTNVQFAKVIDRQTLVIEIWERGAGYTFASGSSSCAAAAVAHKLGLLDNSVTVRMRGGSIHIEITRDYEVTMTGAARKVFDGFVDVCDQRPVIN